MKNFSNGLLINTEGDSTFLEYMTFLKLVPDDFTVKSFAQRKLSVDPQIDFAKIVGDIKECKLERLHASEGYDEAMLIADNYFVFANMRRGHVTIKVAANNFAAKETVLKLCAYFDSVKMTNKEEDGVWVDFSHKGQHGANKTMEFLKCPKWGDIKDNYPSNVKNGITRLTEMAEPWAYGRLLIWNGNPGTGKTYGVRSLMMEWREKFDFLVITDPEAFAADPTYYYSVASEVKDRPAARRVGDQYDDDYDPDGKPPKRLLFILEDSADLILQESRTTHYDKVGKLLNMTDGLFGQGREDLFLITFNEEVDRIDPAFLRPGRCISSIEFNTFSPSEATAWLKSKGSSFKATNSMTLAEMYAKVLGTKSGAPVSVRKDNASELLMKPRSGFGEAAV